MKKITEAPKGLRIIVVYVTSNHSVTAEYTSQVRDVEKVEARVAKEMMEVANTDDWWVDDAWAEDVAVPLEGVMKDLITDKGSRVSQDRIDMIFDDEDFLMKAGVLQNWGYDIEESRLEELYVYELDSSEDWVEGNWGVNLPENWLYEQAEQMELPDIIMKNWSYFQEGVARMISDDEPNGGAKYERVGNNYFVYTYDV